MMIVGAIIRAETPPSCIIRPRKWAPRQPMRPGGLWGHFLSRVAEFEIKHCQFLGAAAKPRATAPLCEAPRSREAVIPDLQKGS